MRRRSRSFYHPVGVVRVRRQQIALKAFQRLALDQPQRAVPPGQSAMLFSGDVMLGGGRITS